MPAVRSKWGALHRVLELHEDWGDGRCWIDAQVMQEHVSKGEKVHPKDDKSSNIERLQSLGWVYYAKVGGEDKRPRVAYQKNGKTEYKRVSALVSHELAKDIALADDSGKDRQPLFNAADRLSFSQLATAI